MPWSGNECESEPLGLSGQARRLAEPRNRAELSAARAKTHGAACILRSSMGRRVDFGRSSLMTVAVVSMAVGRSLDSVEELERVHIGHHVARGGPKGVLAGGAGDAIGGAV